MNKMQRKIKKLLKTKKNKEIPSNPNVKNIFKKSMPFFYFNQHLLLEQIVRLFQLLNFFQKAANKL
jgi:hypothetical protein